MVKRRSFFPLFTQTGHTLHLHRIASAPMCYWQAKRKPFVGMVQPDSIKRKLITTKINPQTLEIGFSKTTLRHLNDYLFKVSFANLKKAMQQRYTQEGNALISWNHSYSYKMDIWGSQDCFNYPHSWIVLTKLTLVEVTYDTLAHGALGSEFSMDFKH